MFLRCLFGTNTARLLGAISLLLSVSAADSTPAIPRFSTNYLNRAVDPTVDFFGFATGGWTKTHPVPADKSRWSGFDELQERNLFLIRSLLEECAADTQAPAGSAKRMAGVFYKSALDTNRIEKLGISPIESDLNRIGTIGSVEEGLRLVADLHRRGVGAVFDSTVTPDPKNSSVYALMLWQGGLGLPDRDYYLADGFKKERQAYQAHIASMLRFLGDSESSAATAAEQILELETLLAKSSRSRVDLRDDEKNYHRKTLTELQQLTPNLPWSEYFGELGVSKMDYVVVGQPEFFQALDRAVKETEPEVWANYLRWHVLRSMAPFLTASIEERSFQFYGTTLRGQPQNEPRWKRAAKVIDSSIGEAVGQLYAERHFPAEARRRMAELVDNLKEVFKDRLARLEWMSEPTRQEALKKFARFTTKIGHPETFRDYSSIVLKVDDYFGNVQRSAEFETKRQVARIGKPVDRKEWGMLPQTVNAYFNPLYNEIVFPAGILQPPFFDPTLDDAINYGAIGVVIGHEITHGYDDQGRKYDAEGNLKDWWTESDSQEFKKRTDKLVAQYGKYEALPGQFVNGQLTLGENIADLGGTSIAFEALQRVLAKNPSKRNTIDGMTPEQRFFLSLSQLWRVNWREAELRRRLTVDPHSPGQFRGIGPHVNVEAFYKAWNITEKSPLYRKPEDRAVIW